MADRAHAQGGFPGVPQPVRLVLPPERRDGHALAWHAPLPLAPGGAAVRGEVETLNVGKGGGRDLLADLCRPPNPNGCGVMLIFGGGFVEGDRRQLAAYGVSLGRAGYTSIACEYRLAGEALWPAGLDDVNTAFRFFHEEAKSLGLSAS